MGEFLSEAVDFGAISNSTVAVKQRTDSFSTNLGVISNITVVEKQRTDSISMNLSYRRRKEVQKEVAFDRECKKLEKVWENRGLPVDRETLCSAASKDAFDMRSLNESLPSTSEKKPTNKELRWKRHPQFASHLCTLRQHLEKRFERNKNCCLISYTPMLSGICPSRTLPPSYWNLPLRKNDIKSGVLRASVLRAQQRERWNRKFKDISSIQFEEIPLNDEQDETSKDSEISFVETNKDSDLNVRKIAFFNAPYQTFTGIHLDDKMEERKEDQNSGIENNHQSVGFVLAPVSKVSQDMNLCPSYDSRKNWIPNFQPLGICPRFQSSNKKQESVYGSKSTWGMAELMGEIRQNSLKELREQSKIRAMYSRRGVLIGDMNGSEIEKPSIKIDSIISCGCNQNHHTFDISGKKDVGSISDRLKILKQRLLEVRKSVKNTRSFRSQLSTGNRKSDKVVPD